MSAALPHATLNKSPNPWPSDCSCLTNGSKSAPAVAGEAQQGGGVAVNEVTLFNPRNRRWTRKVTGCMFLAVNISKSSALVQHVCTVGVPGAMSFNIHSNSPVVVLSPLFKGSGLRGLCRSHQEGAAALAEKLLCPDSVACGQFAPTSPVRTRGQRGREPAFQDLPGPSRSLSFSCCCPCFVCFRLVFVGGRHPFQICWILLPSSCWFTAV